MRITAPFDPTRYPPQARRRDYYSVLRSNGLLSGTIKAALATRQRRNELAARNGGVIPAGYVSIPLGPIDSAELSQRARASRPRVQRWVSPYARNREAGPTCGISEFDEGAYSSRCSYRMVDYAPWIQSYGYCTGARLVATISDERYRYRAPRGWTFGRDDLGVYIVRAGETRAKYRYHLSSDDVRGGLAAMRAAGIRHEVEQRAAQRRWCETRAEARRLAVVTRADDARLREAGGVWVILADSRAAGNCESGTRSWCARYELNPAKRYPVRVIRRLAHTHYSVERVIAAARQRTLAELAESERANA